MARIISTRCMKGLPLLRLSLLRQSDKTPMAAMQWCTTPCSFRRNVVRSSSNSGTVVTHNVYGIDNGDIIGYIPIQAMGGDFQRTDLQYHSRDDAPEKPPDFSILAYANYKTLNRMNLDQLQVTAIRRGALEDNKDVWMVNPDWINVNPTESPFPDPYGMRQSESYQMHLDQVLYVTNTVTLESGYPVQKEAIRVSKIPYTIKDGVQRDIEITTRIWLDCFNIQLALLQDWRNPRGRIALETLMKKACLVCEAVTYEKLGIQRDDLQMDIASIGGDSYFDGGCTVAFATVSQNQVIKQKDSVRVKNSKRNKLTAEETWNEKTYLEKHYTPDVCFRSWSQSSLLSCITGAVKSYKPDKSDIQVVWNQSLIGLQDMEKTYAVIVSPKEAMILKIEIDKRDTVNTYVRHYPLISKGDLDSELVEKFFYDLVLAVWDSRYSEHS